MEAQLISHACLIQQIDLPVFKISCPVAYVLIISVCQNPIVQGLESGQERRIIEFDVVDVVVVGRTVLQGNVQKDECIMVILA